LFEVHFFRLKAFSSLAFLITYLPKLLLFSVFKGKLFSDRVNLEEGHGGSCPLNS